MAKFDAFIMTGYEVALGSLVLVLPVQFLHHFNLFLHPCFPVHGKILNEFKIGMVPDQLGE